MSLSSVASLSCRVATVVASDPVSVAAKRMQELRVNSVIIMSGSHIQGILTYGYSLIMFFIDYLCSHIASLFILYHSVFTCLQLKGSSHASCGTKSSSRVNTC